jgi:hypothetical protein
MYKIIGGDGNEYGPIDVASLRQWIQEGRLNAQSQVKPEGAADWQALGTLPEFATALSQQPPPTFSAPPPTGPVPVAAGDYELDLAACIAGGWNLLKENFGLLFGATLVYFVCLLALAMLGAIPIIGMVFSLVSMVIGGPLLAGRFFIFIQVNRRQPTAVGDLFIGFQTNFGQLFLGQFITSLLAGLCLAPAGIVAALTVLPAIVQQREPSIGALVACGVAALIGLIPMIFLSINWMFTLPLIVDRRLDFWTAMTTSWRQVMRHWWSLFGLVLVAGLLNVAGMLLCGVGVLFSMPIVLGAIILAYEVLFRPGDASGA